MLFDYSIALLWVCLVMGVLYAARTRLFPAGMPIAERKALPVARLVWFGLCLAVISRSLITSSQGQKNSLVLWGGVALAAISSAFFLLAGSRLAFKRGRSWGWGWLGALGPLGLLVIYFLPAVGRPTERA